MAFRFPDALYPIVDLPRSAPVDALLEAVLGAGIRFVQLRAKESSTREFIDAARRAKALADRFGAALIINDRPDVALLVQAAGVHLGQDDMPAAVARAQLGPDRIIGVSTHNAEQVASAVRSGVPDYVAFGPVFATGSKKDPDPVQGVEALRQARRICPLPLVAIGGIGRARLAEVLGTGADAAAILGAICHTAEPQRAIAELLGEVTRLRAPLPDLQGS